MADADISKMKVADLKRELKNRGLSTNGNKNELQDRLQNALLEGDLSFEETSALAGDDLHLLDDDDILNEEAEDYQEKTLLKSPTIETPEEKLDSDCVTEPSASKKVVLKRKILSSTRSDNSVETSLTSKENTLPSSEKSPKLTAEEKPVVRKPILWSNLSEEERKDMRAKKFGGSVVQSQTPKNSSNSNDQNNKQIEVLKKRAERFGCVTSSKIASLEEKERLEKRKERFGCTTVAAAASSSFYAEKARQRLERFKN